MSELLSAVLKVHDMTNTFIEIPKVRAQLSKWLGVTVPLHVCQYSTQVQGNHCASYLLTQHWMNFRFLIQETLASEQTTCTENVNSRVVFCGLGGSHWQHQFQRFPPYSLFPRCCFQNIQYFYDDCVQTVKATSATEEGRDHIPLAALQDWQTKMIHSHQNT